MGYKKIFLTLLMLLLCAAGGGIYFQKKEAPVLAGTNVSVERRDIRAAVAATGTISPVNSVDISSQVTGRITEVKVEENDIVTAGQVLALLDDTSLRAQVEQYRTQLENYAAIYERSKRIARVGGISEQTLETDRTNYLVAQAHYDNYAAQLKYYVIRSPISGMVVGKPIPAGQTVAQGISAPQVIMTIADMSKMQIKVQVDETDIGKIKPGQTVEFTVDTYPDRIFTGKVTRLSRSAVTSSNVVYYPVYVDVDSTEGILYPNMTARVKIVIGERSNALTLPLRAVKESNGRKIVQKVINGKKEAVSVQIGLSDDQQVEIISGLAEGDQVFLPALKTGATANNNRFPGPPPPF